MAKNRLPSRPSRRAVGGQAAAGDVTGGALPPFPLNTGQHKPKGVAIVRQGALVHSSATAAGGERDRRAAARTDVSSGR